MDVISSEITTEGISMNYIKFGNGSKVLVILPGLSIRSVIPAAKAIAKQYSFLTDEFTVYLFERRNNIPNEYSIESMAHDTIKIITVLGLDDIYLFGTSQGGMIALTIASLYPELIKKLVIVSSALHVDESRFSVIERWVKLAEKEECKSLCLLMGETVYSASFFERNRELFLRMAAEISSNDLERFIILANTIQHFDIREQARNIHCPVLYVGDNTDAVFTDHPEKEIEDYFQFNERFEITMFSGCGHALYDTSDLFADVLKSFLMK